MQAKQRAIEEYERGGKAEALQRTNQTLEGLKQRQAAGEAAVKVRGQHGRRWLGMLGLHCRPLARPPGSFLRHHGMALNP